MHKQLLKSIFHFYYRLSSVRNFCLPERCCHPSISSWVSHQLESNPKAAPGTMKTPAATLKASRSRRGHLMAEPLSAAAIFSASTTQSAVIVFTDRPTWEATVGTLSFSENFNGFLADTSFRSSPLAANGFSVQQEGFDRSFRNLLDASPFTFGEGNGTPGLTLFTNCSEPSTGGTRVRLPFNAANIAFRGESSSANDGEGAVIDLDNGELLLASISLANDSNSFRGYLITGSNTVSSLVFRSATLTAGRAGEGFWYDNIAGVNEGAAPSEPDGSSNLALLALALGGILVVNPSRIRSPRKSSFLSVIK
jgi:hypothetical protein